MTLNNKITVILWMIMALSLTGCTVNLQAGKTNSFVQHQDTKRDTYHARKRAGQVSIQETIEHVRGEK